ncbi:MAG: hypothetical protein JWN48_3312 [Myxococcaceae bacterium]|nr:hypothetical protein [Myxococcaceae bacterium]
MVTSRSLRMLLVWLSACALSWLLTACDADSRCGTLATCDVQEVSCQAAALRYAACLRGRNESTDLAIPVTVQPRADYLAARIAEAQASDGAAARSLRRGLALFGLGRAMSTPELEARARYANVIAHYESAPPSIVVVSDGQRLDGPEAVVTLVHEMTHALQDAAGELSAQPASYDAQLAMSAVNEGEATIAEDETWAQGYGLELDALDYGDALFNYRGQSLPFRGEAAADLFDEAYGRFSYAWGASYLWRLRQARGVAALASAHAVLPVSSYAVMSLDPTHPELRPNDLGAAAVPVLPALTFSASLHLGRFVYGMYARTSEDGFLFPVGPDFVADTFSVFSATDGSVLAVWRLRFADPALVTRTLQWLAERGSTLQVGSEGSDLWIVEAETPALAATLPVPLTFQAAPRVDLGLDQTSAAATRIDCRDHVTLALH